MKQLILLIVFAFSFTAIVGASSNQITSVTDVDVGYTIQEDGFNSVTDFNTVISFEQKVIESNFETQSLFLETVKDVFNKPLLSEKRALSWCIYSILNYNYKAKEDSNILTNTFVYFDDHPANSENL